VKRTSVVYRVLMPSYIAKKRLVVSILRCIFLKTLIAMCRLA